MMKIGYTPNNIAFGANLPKVNKGLPPGTEIKLPKLKPGERLTGKRILDAAAQQEKNA